VLYQTEAFEIGGAARQVDEREGVGSDFFVTLPA